MDCILETNRILLRRLQASDLPELFKLLSDPETMKFWPPPFDLEMTEQWLERSIEGYENLGFGRYAVIFKKTGELIGDCGFLRIELDGRLENDLGYIISKRHWGQGFATEAAQACLQYGLSTLGFERVVANMETRHVASRRVAEKIGMRLEKEFSNARNRNLPTYLFSISAEA